MSQPSTSEIDQPEAVGYKYQFDLEVERVQIDIPIKCSLFVSWKRSSTRKIDTKTPILLQGNEKIVPINQKLSNITTCYLHDSKREFKPKPSTISVMLSVNGVVRCAGYYNLDLCSILNPFEVKTKGYKQVEDYLIRPAIGKAQIVFKLTSTFMREGSTCDELSVASSIASIQVSSANQIDCRGIAFQKNGENSQSKDNNSICSGPIKRYPEPLVPKRDDSNRKESSSTYNIAPSSASKTSISRVIMQPFTPGSYSRSRKIEGERANMDNFDPQYTSKQLSDLQNKSSKMESEINRLNLYCNEQGKRLSLYVSENAQLKEMIAKAQQLNDIKQHTELAAITNNLTKLTLDNQQLQSKLHQSREECSKIDEERRRMEYNLTQLQQEKNQAKGRLIAVESDLMEYTRVTRSMQEMEQKLNRSKQVENLMRNQLEKERQRSQREAQEYQRRIEQLNSAVEYEKTQNQTHQTQINTMKNEFRLKFDLSSQKNMYELQRRGEQHQEEKRNLLSRINALQDQAKKDQQSLLSMQLSLGKQITNLKQQLSNVKDGQQKAMSLKLVKLTEDLSKSQATMRRTEQTIRSLQSSQSRLSSDNERLKSHTQFLLHENQQLKNQVNQFNTISQSYRFAEQRLEKALQQNKFFERTIQQLRDQLKSTKAQAQNSSDLMRLKIQMEMEIKFRDEELEKLRAVETQLNELRITLNFSQQNVVELEKQCEKMSSELNVRNRSKNIDEQRCKIQAEQISRLTDRIHQLQQGVRERDAMISNARQQFGQMDAYIGKLEQDIEQGKKNYSLLNQTYVHEKHMKEEAYIKLTVEQKRTSEAISANNLTIKRFQQKESELQAQRSEIQSNKRIKENEVSHQSLNQLQADKRALEMRIEVMMSEMFNIKRKYEEEKAKAIPISKVPDELMKVKTLQNQIDKRDKTISKLTKEKLALESEIVELNVGFIRQLNELGGKDPSKGSRRCEVVKFE